MDFSEMLEKERYLTNGLRYEKSEHKSGISGKNEEAWCSSFFKNEFIQRATVSFKVWTSLTPDTVKIKFFWNNDCKAYCLTNLVCEFQLWHKSLRFSFDRLFSFHFICSLGCRHNIILCARSYVWAGLSGLER